MTEPKIKAAFEKLEFSKDFEENTINKINAKKAERTSSKKRCMVKSTCRQAM